MTNVATASISIEEMEEFNSVCGEISQIIMTYVIYLEKQSSMFEEPITAQKQDWFFVETMNDALFDEYFPSKIASYLGGEVMFEGIDEFTIRYMDKQIVISYTVDSVRGGVINTLRGQFSVQ